MIMSDFSTNDLGLVRIMIVDDHPIVREGLSMLLDGHHGLSVIALVENIADALHQIDRDPPDIAIIDIGLKNESGLDLIGRIKERNRTVRVLVVTMHDESLYGERAMTAGAMGFLNKQAASRKIVEAIDCVREGKVYISDELSERMATRKWADGQAYPLTGVASLTNRELEIFSRIGDGLTTSEIAKRLHLSIKTVESHRQNIKSKLKLRNAAELSREAAQWVLSSRQ